MVSKRYMVNFGCCNDGDDDDKERTDGEEESESEEQGDNAVEI